MHQDISFHNVDLLNYPRFIQKCYIYYEQHKEPKSTVSENNPVM